jgi:putative sterol carrier protein
VFVIEDETKEPFANTCDSGLIFILKKGKDMPQIFIEENTDVSSLQDAV